jgi:hypothetical protein
MRSGETRSDEPGNLTPATRVAVSEATGTASIGQLRTRSYRFDDEMDLLILNDLRGPSRIELGFVLGSFRFVLGSFFEAFGDSKALLGFVFAFRAYPPGGPAISGVHREPRARQSGVYVALYVARSLPPWSGRSGSSGHGFGRPARRLSQHGAARNESVRGRNGRAAGLKASSALRLLSEQMEQC